MIHTFFFPMKDLNYNEFIPLNKWMIDIYLKCVCLFRFWAIYQVTVLQSMWPVLLK